MDKIVERASNALLFAAIVFAALLVAIVLCQPAKAGNCGHFFVKQQVAYVAPVYAAPVYYQAGRDIEAEALAAKVARLVIGQLRAELKSPQQQVAKQSALAQHCSKCHGGAAPKAGVVYDGSTSLACVQVTAALRAIADGHMPKDHRLTPEQKGALMQELLDLEQPANGPQSVDAVPPEPSGDLR